MKRLFAPLFACSMATALAAPASQAQAQDLGALPNSWSYAGAISADATVVAGTHVGVGQASRVFAWSESGGFRVLDPTGPVPASVFDMSRDGAIIAGGTSNQALSWDSATGARQALGTPWGGRRRR